MTQSVLFGNQDLEIRSYVSSFSVCNPIHFFSEMDKNQDGVIDPKEFDKYLDEDIMKQYQNLYYEIL